MAAFAVVQKNKQILAQHSSEGYCPPCKCKDELPFVRLTDRSHERGFGKIIATN